MIQNFKREILNIMNNRTKMPLGTILHSIGYIKANIKRDFPQYEIPENERKNENDKFNWRKFFEENLPEFTVTRARWTDGKETDILNYNEANKKIEEGKTMTVNKTTLPDRIKTLLEYLNQNLYGKEEAVRLALLSAVAGESIFFMGLPGTAKSMISRRIAAAFSDFYKDGNFSTENGGYFEYLMNEFSTPDEICGPVDLSALNEKPSRYTRQTKGYLPSAKVAFLDEIWKSGPAILNTLLTIVNEKKFHNGNKVENVPLLSLAAASNELPEKNRGLDALWDRFILRVLVNPVSNEEDFFKVVDEGNKELVPTDKQKSALLNISEVGNWQAEIDKIELSSEAKNVITAIRKELTSYNKDTKHKGDETYYVSDRRWKKIVHLLKTSAFLNGRDSVDLMDCSLIEYCIWNTDKQQSEASEIIEKILEQNGISFNFDIDDIKDQIKDFDNYITKQFFTKDKDKIETTVTMPDGNNAYQLSQIISIQRPLFFDNIKYVSGSGIYYNDQKQAVGYGGSSVQIDIAKQELSWKDNHSGITYNGHVEFTTIKGQGLVKNPDFDKYPELLKGRQEDAADRYEKIRTSINNSLKDLKDFEAEQAEPFEQNYFVKQKYCDTILSAVRNAQETIENLQVELDKERDRYTK